MNEDFVVNRSRKKMAGSILCRRTRV